MAIPHNAEVSPLDSNLVTPLKRIPSDTLSLMNCEMSRLEALDQDLLIKILCRVDHEDLERLYHVSRTIKEAALIAKASHFQFVTPKKNTFDSFAFPTPIEMADDYLLAPILLEKNRTRASRRNLAHIAVALFASPDEEKWPKKKKYLMDHKV